MWLYNRTGSQILSKPWWYITTSYLNFFWESQVYSLRTTLKTAKYQVLLIITRYKISLLILNKDSVCIQIEHFLITACDHMLCPQRNIITPPLVRPPPKHYKLSQIDKRGKTVTTGLLTLCIEHTSTTRSPFVDHWYFQNRKKLKKQPEHYSNLAGSALNNYEKKMQEFWEIIL